MKDALIKLLKIKSIISLATIAFVGVLLIRGSLEASKGYELALIIFGFYFGTQAGKEEGKQ